MLQQLSADLERARLDPSCLPPRIETVDKLERKIAKLRDCIELELEERSAVENVIGFFTSDSSATTQVELQDDYYTAAVLP